MEFDPAVLLDAGRKPNPSAPETSSGMAPAPQCDFAPLPLGQEAAKLPPLPADEAGDPALGGEPVGDFCPLPDPQHAKTVPGGSTDGEKVADERPRERSEPRTVVRVVPVQRRRSVIEPVAHWILTQTVERTPHGRTISRPAWVRVTLPVRREVVETTWERHVERRRVAPPRSPQPMRAFLVRRHPPRPHHGSGSTILQFFSRLWTAKP